MTDEEKTEKTQITKVRNESRNITNNLTEIKGLVREYYLQMSASILDNPNEIDKFLETTKSYSRRNRKPEYPEGIQVKRSKNLPQRIAQDQMPSRVNSIKYL